MDLIVSTLSVFVHSVTCEAFLCWKNLPTDCLHSSQKEHNRVQPQATHLPSTMLVFGVFVDSDTWTIFAAGQLFSKSSTHPK